MRKLYFILFIVPLFGCYHSVSIKEQQLADTIAKLRKDFDFKPLNSEEAYAFMNKYYLPRLDSLRTKRKIFVHPLGGVDFKELFKADTVNLVKEYTDPHYKPSFRFLIPPPPPSISLNEKYNWDNKKLLKVVIIKEPGASDLKDISYDNINSIKAWHKKYGYGFMCVSYPQYNANTKRLIIREWIENDSFCSTGREGEFWFTKTPAGWIIKDNYRWNMKGL